MPGDRHVCVVSHSTAFASEQLNSSMYSLARATQGLRRIARELAKPQRRHKEGPLRLRIERWLAFIRGKQMLRYELMRVGAGFELTFELDQEALQGLIGRRFGRTVLLTSRAGWSAGEVVQAYAGQQ